MLEVTGRTKGPGFLEQVERHVLHLAESVLRRIAADLLIQRPVAQPLHARVWQEAPVGRIVSDVWGVIASYLPLKNRRALLRTSRAVEPLLQEANKNPEHRRLQLHQILGSFCNAQVRVAPSRYLVQTVEKAYEDQEAQLVLRKPPVSLLEQLFKEMDDIKAKVLSFDELTLSRQQSELFKEQKQPLCIAMEKALLRGMTQLMKDIYAVMKRMQMTQENTPFMHMISMIMHEETQGIQVPYLEIDHWKALFWYACWAKDLPLIKTCTQEFQQHRHLFPRILDSLLNDQWLQKWEVILFFHEIYPTISADLPAIPELLKQVCNHRYLDIPRVQPVVSFLLPLLREEERQDLALRDTLVQSVTEAQVEDPEHRANMVNMLTLSFQSPSV